MAFPPVLPLPLILKFLLSGDETGGKCQAAAETLSYMSAERAGVSETTNQKSFQQSGTMKSSSSFLTIKDLKQRDSAKYKFRFITNQPGGEFTGNRSVYLLRIFTELKCESSCDQIKPPSYVWFNKENKMEEQSSSIVVSVRDGGRYSCSVKGHDDLRSPSVYAPRPPSVSVTPSGEIMEGSLVTLNCSSDANPAAKYTWRKKNNQSVVSTDQQFVLSSILSSDSGQYYCTAQNQLGEKTSGLVSVQVTCELIYSHFPLNAPRPPSVSVTPSGEIMEGSLVTLSCSSDANPAANYSWYKEGEEAPKASGQNFTITNIIQRNSVAHTWRSNSKPATLPA
uniref:Ig-like domain-containing protein n=1 Tax=Xiphophorus couchianus TaxID=32473 RepID=A0A3B5KK12_9TELE